MSHENHSEKNEHNKEEEETTYEKIEHFFKECNVLSFSNFEYFIHLTELNTVFQYEDIKLFWNVFTSSEEEHSEYDFSATLELVEKLGEKCAHHEENPTQKNQPETETVQKTTDYDSKGHVGKF